MSVPRCVVDSELGAPPSARRPHQLPLSELAVANTPQTSAVALGGRPGWFRHEFAETRPLPSYLVALAVGPFDVVAGGAAAPGDGLACPVRLRSAWSDEQPEAQHCQSAEREGPPYSRQGLGTALLGCLSKPSRQNRATLIAKRSQENGNRVSRHRVVSSWHAPHKKRPAIAVLRLLDRKTFARPAGPPAALPSVSPCRRGAGPRR